MSEYATKLLNMYRRGAGLKASEARVVIASGLATIAEVQAMQRALGILESQNARTLPVQTAA